MERRYIVASRSVVILADGLFPVAVNVNALHSATMSRSLVAKSNKWDAAAADLDRNLKIEVATQRPLHCLPAKQLKCLASLGI